MSKEWNLNIDNKFEICNLDDSYSIEMSWHDQSFEVEEIRQLHTWLTDQLGLGWVSVAERLPEDDGSLQVEYCFYRGYGSLARISACSYWCEFKFEEEETATYFGECKFYFDTQRWENTDGSIVIVERWHNLPQLPQTDNNALPLLSKTPPEV